MVKDLACLWYDDVSYIWLCQCFRSKILVVCSLRVKKLIDFEHGIRVWCILSIERCGAEGFPVAVAVAVLYK